MSDKDGKKKKYKWLANKMNMFVEITKYMKEATKENYKKTGMQAWSLKSI
jgi:hypothetical protein